MMTAHKNAVVIGNNREKKQPLVVAMPVNRLIILDTERREAGEIRHPPSHPQQKKKTKGYPKWIAFNRNCPCLRYPVSVDLAQSGLVLSPFPTDFIDLNGCSIFPSSSDPNLAKRSLLFVLTHHFTFISPLIFLVQQQFVLLHFSTLNFTFLILQH